MLQITVVLCLKTCICFSSQSLSDDLEGDTHGDFEDVLVALITPPAKFDCQEFKRAIKVHNLISF